MMMQKKSIAPLGLSLAAASILLLPSLFAQNAPRNVPAAPVTAPAATPIATPVQISPDKQAKPVSSKTAEAAAPAPDRATAYYHYAMAKSYEDEASSEGRPDMVSRAIEEYKVALSTDPASAQLNNGLAEIYFRTGRIKEAEVTARQTLKNDPDNIDAHKLLGRLYLRQLSEGQNTPPSAQQTALDLAVKEFETIIVLNPKSVEDRLLLGQLYTIKHDAKKAEEQFNAARAIEPDSEEVVLNMARLYAESGDIAHAAKVIEAIPVADRSPKMEFTLGAAYDQLKQLKDAIAAYQRASDMDPGDARTTSALAQALLNDNQLDEALKQYKQLADADPDDASTLIRIGDIQRRQKKFEEALATFRKAGEKLPATHTLEVELEIGYNTGLLLDALNRIDEAAQTYAKMVDLASHANGAYTAEERVNRAVFLERLAAIYSQQNKLDQAVATWQKLIDMGGEQAVGGYRGQIDAYTEAKNFDRAAEIAKKAVAANPKDTELKMILAEELIDQGKDDQGIQVAKAVVDAAPNDRANLVSLGHLYARLRRWKEAEDLYARAEPLTTKKEDKLYLFYVRGEMAERQKKYDQAEQIFLRALELEPDNAATLNYLGYMLADKGEKGTRLPEALKYIRKAIEEEPTNGAILDSLGWVYYKLGQYELAEENMLHAIARDQSDPTVHDHLGDLYEKTGRIRLAAAQWELALAGFKKSAAADIEPGDVAKVQHKLDTAHTKLAKQDSALGQPKQQ
jgi:tetratricopeptide (TPR) repeat protein